MDWNYGDTLDAVAQIVPSDRPALMCGHKVVSWSDFTRRSNNIARGLIDLGMKPGDRAAILSTTTRHFWKPWRLRSKRG